MVEAVGAEIARAPAPAAAIGPRVLDVLAVTRIAPHMQRVTFGGPGLDGIPDGPNIKLMIPQDGDDLVMPTVDARGRFVWPEGRRPTLRTYSVRRLDRAGRRLDIDFVLHGHAGPAAEWAASARPGARLIVGGPGGRDIRPAGFYVLAGDHCALPAISYALENLPRDARGLAFIDVPSPDDRLPLDPPPGVEVTWLHNPPGESRLAEAVRGVEWADPADSFLWVGAESEEVRAIRAFARDELRLDRRMVLAIGYWKRGMSEDAYHKAHDNDRDADYHAVWAEERVRKATNA